MMPRQLEHRKIKNSPLHFFATGIFHLCDCYAEKREIPFESYRDYKQICDINQKHNDTLPAAELLADDSRYGGNKRNENGNGKIEVYILKRNGEFAAVNKRADGENQRCIDNIRAYYIADGHGGLLLDNGCDSCDKLRKRRLW